MSKVTTAYPETGRTDAETIQNLFDNVLGLRRELEYALLNLDSENVPGLIPMADAIQANTDEFLTLGDLATLDSITSTYIDDNSITTPKLAAGSVVASKMSVGSLSAISANLGTVTAGTITGIDVIGSKFYGDNEYSGYIDIGSNGNAADLSLYRGALSGVSHPSVQFYDQLNYMQLRVGDGLSAPTTILDTDGSTTSPRGNWSFGSATVTGLTATAEYA